MGKSDAEIIKAYFDGDDESLRVLINRYLKPVYNFVFQYVTRAPDAEDITQDVFIRAWRHLDRFDLKRSFKVWVFSIARNAALDFIRKKKTIPFSDFEDEKGGNPVLAGLADEEPVPDEILRRKDLGRFVNAAVKKLPPAARVILYLYYYDGFNLREIAQILGASPDTVKSRHRRALIALKEEMKRLEDDTGGMHPER